MVNIIPASTWRVIFKTGVRDQVLCLNSGAQRAQLTGR